MRRSTVALLLSALVLPGAGHVYLKHYWRGVALMGVSLVCLSVMVTQVMQQASAVLDQLLTEGGAIDAEHITDLVTRHADAPSATLATLVLAACWVAGILDAYRLGKRQARPPA
jgi:hypothetical protein